MAVFPETGAALSSTMGTRRSHVARFQRTVRLVTQFTDVLLVAAALVIEIGRAHV